MHRLREFLTIVLLLALPFHALVVTVLTRLLLGPGHAPLSAIAFWKELLLLMILVLACSEQWNAWGAQRGARRATRMDTIDVLIVSFVMVSIGVSLGLHVPLRQLAFGIRYDLVPLGVFLLLRRVAWSQGFRSSFLVGLLLVGGAVALYGIATLFLPQAFFTALGYSDLHSLYVPHGSLAAFQQIGGTGLRRMQSTMSGPNQLGLWLLIPWSVGVAMLLGGRTREEDRRKRGMITGVCLLLVTAVLLTCSRAAWIGAAVIAGVIAWQHLPRQRFVRWLLTVGSAVLAVVFGIALLRPSVLLRAASTRDHLLRPLATIQTIAVHPLGLGLGSAGPASNRISDACVFLDAGGDASWAADRPDLCVFVGDDQVQPVDRACSCPNLPENVYLQIGVEAGVAGMLLFLGITGAIIFRLWSAEQKKKNEKRGSLPALCFSLFLAISVAALVLHAWEDAAVAWTVWAMVAMVLPVASRPASA